MKKETIETTLRNVQTTKKIEIISKVEKNHGRAVYERQQGKKYQRKSSSIKNDREIGYLEFPKTQEKKPPSTAQLKQAISSIPETYPQSLANDGIFPHS